MREMSGPLAGKRVLIVEDEWLIADDLVRALRAEGAQIVGPAASVEAAMRLLETSQVDAAVLDIQLDKGSSVYPVAEALRDLHVPFLFATGFDEERVRSEFQHVRHVVKPYEPHSVGRILADATASASVA